MKKLLLMAAAALGFAAAPVAQADSPVTLSTPESPTYYLIKNVRSGKYANAVNGSSQIRQATINADDEMYEVGTMWYFVAADDATAAEGWTAVRIYNANVSGKSIANPVNGTWSDATSGTDNLWYINNDLKTSGNKTGYAISHQAQHGHTSDVTQQAWNDYYAQGNVIAYDHSNDDGSVWVFELADDQKAANTINFRDNSIEVTYTYPSFLNLQLKTRLFAGADASRYISHPLFTGASLQEENTTVAADNTSFTVAGEPNFDQVFRIALRNKGAANNSPACQNLYYNDGTGKIETRNAASQAAFVPERLFYLKKAEGYAADNMVVTIHSIATKDEYGFQNTAENNNVGTMTTTPVAYKIVANGWANNNFGGFSLQHPDNERAHVNDVRGELGCWTPDQSSGSNSQPDPGSCFRLYPLTDAEIDAFNYVSTDAAKSEIIAAAKENKSVSNIRAIFDGGQVNAETLTSSYYRITFVDGNKNLTVVGYADATGAIAAEDGDHNLVKQAVASETDMSQIWHFVNASSERAAYPIFGICSANANGYYLNRVNHLTNTLEGAYKYRVYRDGDVYVARIGGGWDDAYINPSNTGDDAILTWNSGFRSNGNKMRLTVVSAITIPVADGETYATVAFPFAVKADKAVFAAEKTQTHITNGDSYLKITEIDTENTIPAATGLILDNATVFTPVAPNEAVAQTGVTNLLTGITLKRQGTFAANSHFALSGTTFAKNAEATELAANSAILPVEAVTNETHQAAAALTITKADVSTSISEIVAGGENGAKVIYDLQGRRVANASKGIFIINGVKTLVK